jgi:hypothetical protein
MRQRAQTVWGCRDVRRWFTLGALCVSLLLLYWLLRTFGAVLIDRVRLPDYHMFRQIGHDILAGKSAYHSGRLYYPLPTAIFVFVPLALLPEEAKWLWVAAPVIVLFLVLGRDAVWALPFVPLLVHTKWGQITGVLAIFYVWLKSENKWLSGASAALFCLKPHVAAIPVLWVLSRWCRERDKERLVAFLGTLALLVLPAFWLEPDWPLKWLGNARPFQANVAPSLWGLLWGLSSIRDRPSLWFSAFLLGAAVSGWWFIWRRRQEMDADRINTWAFVVNPLLFVYDQVLLLSSLKGKRNAVIMVTCLSYVCMLAEGLLVGGSAGTFVLIPLALLGTWRWHTLVKTPTTVPRDAGDARDPRTRAASGH